MVRCVRKEYIILCKQFRGAFSGGEIHFLRLLRREGFPERLSSRWKLVRRSVTSFEEYYILLADTPHHRRKSPPNNPPLNNPPPLSALPYTPPSSPSHHYNLLLYLYLSSLSHILHNLLFCQYKHKS